MQTSKHHSQISKVYPPSSSSPLITLLRSHLTSSFVNFYIIPHINTRTQLFYNTPHSAFKTFLTPRSSSLTVLTPPLVLAPAFWVPSTLFLRLLSLPFFSSIFHAEQAAIFNAIEYIIQNFASGSFLIIVDSLSALHFSPPSVHTEHILPMDTVPLRHPTQRQSGQPRKAGIASSSYGSPYLSLIHISEPTRPY